MSDTGDSPDRPAAERPSADQAPTDRAVDAFLRLVVAKGFAGVALRDVAQEAGLGFAELYRLHADKASLIAAFLKRVDGEVLAGTPTTIDEEETARDRLFEVMMRRYDSLKPYREAWRALRQAARRDPLLALAMAPALRRSMAAMLEAASIPSDGFAGAMRQNGLLAIHHTVSGVFDADETADLSKTMAALDNRLKTAERWSQLFDKYRKIPKPASVTEPPVSPAA